MSTFPESAHFVLKQLAAGVWAALARDDGAAFSNAGIVDLGERTLIFDTTNTHLAAQDLRRAALQLTGRPPSFVINSHGHNDHWLGNQVFAADCPIIATAAAREWMPSGAQHILDLQKDPRELRGSLAQAQAQLQAESDERKRAPISAAVARLEFTLQALPEAVPVLPEQTFENRLYFYGTQRSAALIAPGKAHTSGDCYLALPDDCILFMGDLAFFNRQPFMQHCDPDRWIEVLEELEGTCTNVYVPGHGRLGGKEQVNLLRRYLIFMQSWVREELHSGARLDSLLETPLPEPFAALSPAGLPQEGNVRFLYDLLKDEDTPV